MKYRAHLIAILLLGIPAAGTAENETKVTQSLQAAADQGDAEAQFQLARGYLRGEGVKKDLKKAYDLMMAAAAQGHADAIGGLGYFHSAGLAVPKDMKQAEEWFRKGAAKGSSKARFNLGKLLLDGKVESAATNPEKSLEEGLQWIKTAADQKLPEACLFYGNTLYFGEHGLKADHENAHRYFTIAADAGNVEARNFLGVMSESGAGCPQDTAAALEWYHKAALQGYAKAQGSYGRLLGPLSENKETRKEALAWLILAANQGEVTAQKELDDTVDGLKEGELQAAETHSLELRKLVRKDQ